MGRTKTVAGDSVSGSIATKIRQALPDLPEGLSDEEAVEHLIAAHATVADEVRHVSDSLESFSDAMLVYAEGDYDAVLDENTGHDLVDSIALGMNCLAEEIRLRSSDVEAARDEALAASRAKSAFLANMSHELRTPMNAIIGYSELIADETDSPELLSDIGKILAAGRSLLALISDILDLSKVEAGKMDLLVEPVNAASLVADVIDTLGPLASNRGNKLIGNSADVVFNTDVVKLRQILLNLMANANKFTTDGSIELRLEQPDDVVITVTDTGIGIDADRCAAIFEPFTQARLDTGKNHGGTGLGLTITRRFCDMLGGQISVESEVGKGSVFTVRLPPIHPTATGTPVVAPPRVYSGPSVLVIDDDPVVPELVRRHLQSTPAVVTWARTGEEGLALARKRPPALITLDVMLPGDSGWEVLAALKNDAELAAIPVVMMSIVSDRTRAVTLGAHDYLVKPVNRQLLLDTVARHLPAVRTTPAEILVVDDQPMVREVLERNLVNAGHQVALAIDGVEALAQMRKRRPDVVILDLMMPRMDGFQVIEAVERDPGLRDLPLVVLTAMELSAEDRARFSAGVASVLSKTVPTEKVLDAVGTALRSAMSIQLSG